MDLMKTLTDLLTPIVTPDWGALVGLIPGILAILFVVWFALTLRAFATAGPTRRAPARIEPLTPPELHMPGPSAAPILVALGAAALFGGLVIGGVALVGSVVILVATLSLWGREAMRDYAHLEPVQTLPAVVREPPPGVHMPGPSIRPFMGALGVSALFGGLIVGGLVLLVSVLFLAWTLIGWLIDFRAPRPRRPTGPVISRTSLTGACQRAGCSFSRSCSSPRASCRPGSFRRRSAAPQQAQEARPQDPAPRPRRCRPGRSRSSPRTSNTT